MEWSKEWIMDIIPITMESCCGMVEALAAAAFSSTDWSANIIQLRTRIRDSLGFTAVVLVELVAVFSDLVTPSEDPTTPTTPVSSSASPNPYPGRHRNVRQRTPINIHRDKTRRQINKKIYLLLISVFME